MLPSLVRTYAPAGQTPILRTLCRYEHLSVMAAVTMEGQLFTHLRNHSLRSEDSVAFLRHLCSHLSGGKLLVIWDGSPIHRLKAMRTFRFRQEAEGFVFESLPGYTPQTSTRWTPASGTTPRTWRWPMCAVTTSRNYAKA